MLARVAVENVLDQEGGTWAQPIESESNRVWLNWRLALVGLKKNYNPRA